MIASTRLHARFPLVVVVTWFRQRLRKNELLSRAAEIFGGSTSDTTSQEKVRELHEKIGELTVERDFLDRALGRFPGSSGKR